MKRTYELAGSVALALVAWAYAGAPGRSEPIASSDVRVIDGNTVQFRRTGANIRLVGFAAPMADAPRCEREAELGERATRRLQALLRLMPLDYEPVPCACPPGTEGSFTCEFGRLCGTLKAGGRDVGLILIAERLAVPFRCGQTRCLRTPQPWCKGG
jgi:endonuclease YncB( thermonuclease family)